MTSRLGRERVIQRNGEMRVSVAATAMENEEFDVVVVGAGVVGSCAAFSLAQEGVSAALVDQFPLPHFRGSSGGQSRIAGLADYSMPYMQPIINHGYRKWLKISSIAATTLVRTTPILNVGLDHDVINAKAKILENCGFKPTWLSADDINAKYKSNFPKDSLAFIDPSGGTLYAQKCVETVRKLFCDLGGVVLGNWPVKKIEPGDPWITLTGPRTVIRAKQLVLCPGPWAAKVLKPLGIDLPLKAVSTGIFYWKVKEDKFPASNICDWTDPGNFFYAMPPIEYPGLVKVGVHDGVVTNPDLRDKSDISGLRKRISQYIAQRLPNVESEPAIEESCMYTMTPDEECVIDYHPEHNNIIYAVGFSGRGFKIAPAVGDILAGMVQGHDPFYDMTPFRADRFDKVNSSTPSKY